MIISAESVMTTNILAVMVEDVEKSNINKCLTSPPKAHRIRL